MLLEEVGLKVDLAEDGRQAVEKTRSGNYAVILHGHADAGAGRPRSDPTDQTTTRGRETTPIVAMTANAFIENKDQCFDAGMNDFIAKPVAEALYETLVAVAGEGFALSGRFEAVFRD